MGYTTTFNDAFTIEPPLREPDRAALALLVTQQPDGAPTRHCGWEPSENGATLRWDGEENFADYAEWATFLFAHFLIPRGYRLRGEVRWQGEDEDDHGVLCVRGDIVVAEPPVFEVDPKRVADLREQLAKPATSNAARSRRLEAIGNLVGLVFESRSRELLALLAEYLADPEPKIRTLVVDGLGMLLDRGSEPGRPPPNEPFAEVEIAPLIRRALADTDERVRVACTRALQLVADGAADLERLSTRDPSQSVRDEATYALRDIS